MLIVTAANAQADRLIRRLMGLSSWKMVKVDGQAIHSSKRRDDGSVTSGPQSFRAPTVFPDGCRSTNREDLRDPLDSGRGSPSPDCSGGSTARDSRPRSAPLCSEG